MTFRRLRTDEEIRSAFPLMAALRDRIRAETFLDEVRRQEHSGYELVGGFDKGRLVTLAGVRRAHTLSRGEHLFVDDLVTDESVRGKGYGRQTIQWLSARARAEGLRAIYLDSRATARGFYEKLGFTFHTSIPSWLRLED
ncbi:MAG TPA: GNAT family N-acetyltransferase [Vicinamibacterales bacterium]|nr:GNAT family N-acetyltransferase [Vicinamibacterales bacterium]